MIFDKLRFYAKGYHAYYKTAKGRHDCLDYLRALCVIAAVAAVAVTVAALLTVANG